MVASSPPNSFLRPSLPSHSFIYLFRVMQLHPHAAMTSQAQPEQSQSRESDRQGGCLPGCLVYLPVCWLVGWWLVGWFVCVCSRFAVSRLLGWGSWFPSVLALSRVVVATSKQTNALCVAPTPTHTRSCPRTHSRTHSSTHSLTTSKRTNKRTNKRANKQTKQTNNIQHAHTHTRTHETSSDATALGGLSVCLSVCLWGIEQANSGINNSQRVEWKKFTSPARPPDRQARRQADRQAAPPTTTAATSFRPSIQPARAHSHKEAQKRKEITSKQQDNYDN